MNTNDSGPLGWLTARPIAHRGLHDREQRIIENSQSAFAAAVDHDYAIECDLQLAGDGEAMVFHDATLDRLTGETGRIDALSAAEIGRIVLTGSSDRPQTLSQLLDQVDGRVALLIELKSRWDASEQLARRVCDLVAGYRGRAALMSFDPMIVGAIRKFAPQIARGGVVSLFEPRKWPKLSREQTAALQLGETMWQTEPHFMSYSVKALASPGAKRYRASGKPIICWTVREAAVAEQALQHSDQITFEGFLA